MSTATATRASTLAALAARDSLVEDVQWLAETGECWSQAVIRTGYHGHPEALERRLTRAGHYDLVTTLRRRELSERDRNCHTNNLHARTG